MSDHTTVYLRKSSKEDEEFVRFTEKTCMYKYAVELWGYWKANAADFIPELHKIVIYEATDVGCIETALHADHISLDKLYLLPRYQRQGIGSHVLRSLVGEARRLALPLRLSVLTTNPAQAFYRREGLRELSRDAERIRFAADYFP